MVAREEVGARGRREEGEGARSGGEGNRRERVAARGEGKRAGTECQSEAGESRPARYCVSVRRSVKPLTSTLLSVVLSFDGYGCIPKAVVLMTLSIVFIVTPALMP